MVLHGIVLLALARGLYLARHLPTLFKLVRKLNDIKITVRLEVPEHTSYLSPQIYWWYWYWRTLVLVTNICLHRYIGGIGDKCEGCAGG